MEGELHSEKASALKRICDRLDELLALLEHLAARFDRLPDPERQRVGRQHEDVRRMAERQRWFLLVQREAMGLRPQAIVDELYPPPRRLQARGPDQDALPHI